MAATLDFAELKQTLLAESSRQSTLAKAYEDLQLQHSLKVQECQRMQADRDGLLASQSNFYDKIADNTRMQRSLTQTVEELAVARLALTAADQQKHEREQLKAQNELLAAKLGLQHRDSAAKEEGMKQRHELEVSGLRGKLSAAAAEHTDQLAVM